jgi:type I restriction enzyme S subunit
LLEEYKKGIIQKIFVQELRFKDENGNEFPDWENKKLSEKASFFSGGTPLTTKKEFYDGNIPFIKSGEINKDKTEQFISEEGLKTSSAKMVNIGDLLYALYGATSGEASISKINGAVNQAVLCIRSDVFHKVYLLNYLQFNKLAIVEKYIQGGQGNLSADIVKKLVIPFPCFEEQEKIATFLATINDKINRTQAQIEQTQQYKKGLLQNMFV